jgi:tRNA-modifying protein YgfZ
MPSERSLVSGSGLARRSDAAQVEPMPFRLDRAFLRVSGPDAVSFLDNLLTQDVTKPADAGVVYGALLTPQGKVIADMLLWREDIGVLIELNPARADDILRRLTIYKLRANVAIEAASDRAALWDADAFEGAGPDPRLPSLGWRGIGQANGDLEDGAARHDAQRIVAGVPDLAKDAAPDVVFALEALLEELNGVVFQKGCFVGQENVSRMKRRATTRKKFCPVVFEGEAPAYGATVSAGAAELGSIRSSVPGRAIAFLRLDRALEAIEKGEQLVSSGIPLRLDPPSWLILPTRDA